MSYLCPGVFAEGPTDYSFLLTLLDRLLPHLALDALSRVPTIGESVGIDAPGRPPARRADRIVSAVDAFWGQCTLFVIHSDGEGDPERALRERIEPGISAARVAHPDIAIAACVPVREIEAWLLADEGPFEELLRSSPLPGLPSDPEAVLDPKQELGRLLALGNGPKLNKELYAFFGANVGLSDLRRLPAFCRFEEQLVTAIQVAAQEH